MSYHGRDDIHAAYPFQWNAGGYILKDTANQWVQLMDMVNAECDKNNCMDVSEKAPILL